MNAFVVTKRLGYEDTVVVGVGMTLEAAQSFGVKAFSWKKFGSNWWAENFEITEVDCVE